MELGVRTRHGVGSGDKSPPAGSGDRASTFTIESGS